jgi:flagellar basal body P-ring protein FlgI
MRDHPPVGRLADELASADVRFTISDGQVTGIEHVIGSRTIAAGLPAVAVTAMTQTFGNAGWTHSVAVAGSTVTETAIRGNTLETLQFTTTDGTTYKLASETLAVIPVGTATTADLVGLQSQITPQIDTLL